MPYNIHQQLAYNVWANEELAKTIDRVTEEQLIQPVLSSYPTLRETLLHIWEAQVIWPSRMQNKVMDKWPRLSFVGGKKEVMEALVTSAKDMQKFASEAEAEFLAEKMVYRNMRNMPYETVKEEILFHVVNHGSYHRGQAITIIRGLGITKIDNTDLITYLRISSGQQV
ncbi:MAG: DinB family protein [Imperialibacter sp.]|uniref:DinB family protein n=1 Tax=Imperialibacter sp. TaxID=2038411 RepID=UPI0032EF01BB